MLSELCGDPAGHSCSCLSEQNSPQIAVVMSKQASMCAFLLTASSQKWSQNPTGTHEVSPSLDFFSNTLYIYIYKSHFRWKLFLLRQPSITSCRQRRTEAAAQHGCTSCTYLRIANSVLLGHIFPPMGWYVYIRCGTWSGITWDILYL